MKLKSFVKAETPEGKKTHDDEVYINVYGTSVDKNGSPVNYLIRNERVNITHLEHEIERAEERLNEMKEKLKAAKGD